MKVVLFGANGTIGKHVTGVLEQAGHQVIKVGKKTGAYQANIADANSIKKVFQEIGEFDAVANASGDVAFESLQNIKPEHWDLSFGSKLRGQINIVEQALPYIKEKGSFTLVSGILGKAYIPAGTIAATVNSAIDAYVKAAALELPKGIRINVVSPTLLEDSLKIYGDFFPGFKPTDGHSVALAYKRSIMGLETGRVFEVL